MTELVIFCATFGTVFALGFQSQCVNSGHYIAAFFNSLAIGTGQFFILKLVPEAHGIGQYMAYLLGGPLGIIASMWAHRRWM